MKCLHGSKVISAKQCILREVQFLPLSLPYPHSLSIDTFKYICMSYLSWKKYILSYILYIPFSTLHLPLEVTPHQDFP